MAFINSGNNTNFSRKFLGLRGMAASDVLANLNAFLKKDEEEETPSPGVIQSTLTETGKGIADIPKVVGQGLIQGLTELPVTAMRIAETISGAGAVNKMQKAAAANMEVPPLHQETPLDYMPGVRQTRQRLENISHEEQVKQKVADSLKLPSERFEEMVAPINAASQEVVNESNMPAMGQAYFQGTGRLAANLPLAGGIVKALGPTLGIAVQNSLSSLSRGDLKGALIDAASGASMGKLNELTGNMTSNLVKSLVNAAGDMGVSSVQELAKTGKMKITPEVVSSALLGFAFDTGEGKAKVPKEITTPEFIQKFKAMVAGNMGQLGEALSPVAGITGGEVPSSTILTDVADSANTMSQESIKAVKNNEISYALTDTSTGVKIENMAGRNKLKYVQEVMDQKLNEGWEVSGDNTTFKEAKAIARSKDNNVTVGEYKNPETSQPEWVAKLTEISLERSAIGGQQAPIKDITPDGVVKSTNEILNEALSEYNGYAKPPVKKAAREAAASQYTPFKESNWFYRMMFSSGATVEKMGEWAKSNGIDVADPDNPSLMLKVSRGHVGIGHDIIRNGPRIYDEVGNVSRIAPGLEPALKEFQQKSGLKFDEFSKIVDDFFFLTRTKTDLLRKTNKDLINLETGKRETVLIVKASPLDLKRAIDIDNKFQTDKARSQYLNDLEKLNDTKNKYQHGLLDMMGNAGLFDSGMIDTLKKENPNHVPFNRILLEQSSGLFDDITGKQARKSGIRGRGKEFKGGSGEVGDLVEGMITDTYKATRATMENLTKRAIVNMGGYMPDIIYKEKIKVIPTKVDIDEIVAQVKKENPGVTPETIEALRSEAEGMTIFRPSRVNLGNDQMLVYQNGTPEIWHVPESISRMYKFEDLKVGQTASDMMVNFFNAFKNITTAGVTMNPAFTARNLFRDTVTNAIQTSLDVPGVSVDPVKAMMDTVGEKGAYDDYMAAGGGMEGTLALSHKGRVLKRYKDIMGNKTLLQKLNVVSTWTEFTQKMEEVNRVRVFTSEKRKGASDIAAAVAGRESSVDFGRAGEHVQKLYGRVIPFFNPALQGLDRTRTAFKNDPVGTSLKAIATVTIPELITFAINNRDEESQKKFKALPRWQKDYFWVMPVGESYISIPKPPLYGQLFGSLPGRALEYHVGKNPKSFDKVTSMLVGSSTPVQGETATDNIVSLMPVPLRIIFEQATNTVGLTGKPIIPRNKLDMIPSQQSSDYNTATMKRLGKIMDTSPAQLEHMFRSLTAGTGMGALQAFDRIVFPGEKRKVGSTPLKEIPFVGDFVTRAPGAYPEQMDYLYEEYGRLNKVKNSYDALLKSNKPEDRIEAKILAEDNPELRKMPYLKKQMETLTRFNKTIQEITNMNIDDNKKRELIGKVEKQRLTFSDNLFKYMFPY